ncbi:hypothetical protein ABZZ79_35220 [Streptomyces sp. NPDC006458]|uniref:hypothetical protein n=1 Tax=Streptomyces sp. NPDC006458 TaxID=3154302 RepID=UPI0033A79977
MQGVTAYGTQEADSSGNDRTAGHDAQSVPENATDTFRAWRGIGLRTMSAMLVLSLRRVGTRAFEAHCQWPRLHPLNERRIPVAHHPLIMVESLRQLAALLDRGDTQQDAALEPVSVRLGLRAGAQPLESGDATDVQVRLTVTDIAREGARVVACRVSGDCLHDGTAFGSCTMRLVRRARGTGVQPSADAVPPVGLLYPTAEAVGAAAETDVLLARTPQGRLALAPRDPGHPVYLPGRPPFLPAAALLEAGRQAMLLASGRTAAAVTGLSVDVHSPVPSGGGAFMELTGQSLSARFAVLADGRAAATGTVGLLGA